MRKLLEAFGLAGLAVLVRVTYDALYGPNSLPDRVPVHFDAAGNPNGWGSPHAMIVMPVIALAIYLLISVAAQFPSSFSYPVRPRPQTLSRLQAITLDMLSWLKAELAWLFAVLQWAFVRSARSGNGGIFPAMLPGILLVILGTLGWHLFALFRAARGNAVVNGP